MEESPNLSYEIYGQKGDHPVVWVNCEDAEEYAKYVGGRLPSFTEWQYAARGNDDRMFPWGYEIDKPRCNTVELGANDTTPVGAFKEGISPLDVMIWLAMCGNGLTLIMMRMNFFVWHVVVHGIIAMTIVPA